MNVGKHEFHLVFVENSIKVGAYLDGENVFGNFTFWKFNIYELNTTNQSAING